ncbi:hypothetical protein [Maliponia aquimaris]|uniref:Thioredoxin domain-containing protein n=1 Tax=Maliponia aquimaris TaxID=1673631 RepID=A0A238KPN9_9RHOB|nr:hypothetical protein [Maliponia aquimaris]SMX44809.1 hypothetical protein MAA8898_03065 [Maliponia aquimaris]
MSRVLVALTLAATAAGAQTASDSGPGADFRARLKALQTPAPVIADPYAEDIASDLARIAAEDSLFDPSRTGFGPDGVPVIAILTGPDCPDCAAALTALEALVTRLGVRAAVVDTAHPEDAAIMTRLGLDTLPSYVMPDRLIRGDMPVLVLERYLSE